MKTLSATIFFLFSLLIGRAQRAEVAAGWYRAEVIGSEGNRIPFQFTVSKIHQGYELTLVNASERLRVSEWTDTRDSVFITLPLFDAEFHIKIKPGGWDGFWLRHLPAGTRRYPLVAVRTEAPRFPANRPPLFNISGLWEMNFEARHHPGVGEFVQEPDGKVTGSILSVTGDDRFLEGRVCGDSLYLSTFDGSHAYLYKAAIDSGGKRLYGGKFITVGGHPTGFRAKFNRAAQLEDVYSITSFKKGIDTLSFRFNNLRGGLVKYPSPQFGHKVTIIQFMGSWCPNCMDETAFLSRFYDEHRNEVNIIALAYERSNDLNLSRRSVQKLVDRFHIQYPVLMTGFTNQPAEVMKSIPEFQNYFAFPTMLILDKNGKLNRIHTGFSGPGTGHFYQDFEKEFTELVAELNSKN